MTRADWFKLPLKLRQRYWAETNYGEQQPSAELAGAILRALPCPWCGYAHEGQCARLISGGQTD